MNLVVKLPELQSTSRHPSSIKRHKHRQHTNTSTTRFTVRPVRRRGSFVASYGHIIIIITGMYAAYAITAAAAQFIGLQTDNVLALLIGLNRDAQHDVLPVVQKLLIYV